MKALATALMNKAANSNFLGSIGGRFRNGRAEEGEAYPYSLFLLPVSNDPQGLSTFDRNYDDIYMQFSIYSSLYAPSEAWTIHGYLTALYDYCSLSITGKTLIVMKRINTVLIPEDHTVPGKNETIRVWHIATDYNLLVKN